MFSENNIKWSWNMKTTKLEMKTHVASIYIDIHTFHHDGIQEWRKTRHMHRVEPKAVEASYCITVKPLSSVIFYKLTNDL